MSVAEIKETIHSMASTEQIALVKDIIREMPKEERERFLEDLDGLIDSIIIEEAQKEGGAMPYEEFRKQWLKEEEQN